MVKADLSRDYYGDLDLQPGADTAEIKKQFKKLALTYHPDRNPGRENEVIAKFQQIQSAHEVLTDAQERAKYDNNRLRSSSRFGGGFTGSSGVRGNPWSDIGSQYPPPPKAPTARRPAQPQQPSAGAERYKKWEAPKQSAYQAAQEGAGARQKTYEAWESMKTKSQPSGQPRPPGPTPTANRPPQVPPRDVPPRDVPREGAYFGRDPSQNQKKPHDYVRPPTVKTTYAYDAKRFEPKSRGGDEPAASKGAYSTERKPGVAPDLPARDFPPPKKQTMNPGPDEPLVHDLSSDDLKKFFGAAAPEPRISTPYSTHGGEKLNPFESSNMNRSHSTREASQRFDADDFIPRPGSDPNLRRSQSSAARGHRKTPSPETETSSSDDGPRINVNAKAFGNAQAFGKARARATKGTSAADGQVPPSPLNPGHQRKPSNVAQFQQWYKENPHLDPPLNGFPPEGPSLRSQTKPDAPPESKAEPSMYAPTASLKSHLKHSAAMSKASPLPTVSEEPKHFEKKTASTSNPFVIASSKKYPNLLPKPHQAPVTHSSGITDERGSLTAFEGLQRNVIDQLLNTKQHASSPSATSVQTPQTHDSSQKQGYQGTHGLSGTPFTKYRESTEAGSPSKKTRASHLHSSHSYDSSQARGFWTELEKLKATANASDHDRFSFNVNDDTFSSPTTSKPSATGFNSSAENISTKFSEKDWTGKFEGSEYFKPVPRANAPPPRTQSGSRTRGRSPTKPTADPRYSQTRGSESENVAESPGGTKFSAQEWADTFKPQTFAPPPPRQAPSRKRTGPILRTTMGGGAAVVDDSETSDEKPLFNGQKTPVTPTMPSPDAMDVDPTPPMANTVPQFKPPTALHVETTTSPKRAAAPTPSPTDDAALKVNFDDLKIQDLLSTLEMPRPPHAPALPENLPNTRPSEVAYEDYKIRFAKYMTGWDLYNNQFLLHLVARKNQNDALGTKRWLNDEGLELYRRGLKEDSMVLSRWAAEKEKHESVVREWLVLKEKIKEGAAREPARARKKTH